jgi:hypothetical protein
MDAIELKEKGQTAWGERLGRVQGRLNLRDETITPLDVQEIIVALRPCPSGTPHSGHALYADAHFAQRQLPSDIHICVRICYFVLGPGLTHISMLPVGDIVHNRINHLDLSNTKINPSHVSLLSALLADNTSIHHLALSCDVDGDFERCARVCA